MINDLSVIAFSASAHRSHVDRLGAPGLMISAGGCLDMKSEGKTVRVDPKTTALFIPSHEPVSFESSACAPVLIRFNQQRLEHTAKQVLGPLWDERISRFFNEPCKVSLQVGAVSFDRYFGRLFSMIDAYGDNDALRDAVGIDELFYRAAIMAMLPVRFPKRKSEGARDS